MEAVAFHAGGGRKRLQAVEKAEKEKLTPVAKILLSYGDRFAALAKREGVLREAAERRGMSART